MLVREYTRYRAVYCGLCKTIGRRYGQPARLAVNYDATLLALFFLAFAEDEAPEKRESCLKWPLNPHPIAAAHPVLDFAADLTAALSWWKGADDQADGSFWWGQVEKSLFPAAPQRFRALYPELSASLEKGLAEQAALEKRLRELFRQDSGLSREAQLQRAALPSGRMLSAIFAEAARRFAPQLQQDARYADVLATFSAALGRWIYLMDALDDREKDAQKGRFNPLMGLPEKTAPALANAALISEEKRMDLAASLFPYRKDGPILENIVHLGLPVMRSKILSKTGCPTAAAAVSTEGIGPPQAADETARDPHAQIQRHTEKRSRP